jgi:ubiquitin-like modifier-activating enzyme ATG7
VRGFLTHFQNIVTGAPAFNCCTACSAPAVLGWKLHGFDFVLRGLNDPKYLEDLTGLTAMREAVDNHDFAMGSSDDDDF